MMVEEGNMCVTKENIYWFKLEDYCNFRDTFPLIETQVIRFDGLMIGYNE